MMILVENYGFDDPYEEDIMGKISEDEIHRMIVDNRLFKLGERIAPFYANKGCVGQKNDVQEYNVMIKAYGKAQLYAKAISLFRGMRNQGTWPDECTYKSLIQMLSNGDLVDEARDLLAEMQESGFKPSCSTFSAVIADFYYFNAMEKSRISVNRIVLTSMIKACSEICELRQEKCFHGIVVKCGFECNEVIAAALIDMYGYNSEADDCRQMFDEIRDPDAVCCTSVIFALTKCDLYQEAVVMFCDWGIICKCCVLEC